MLLESDFRIIFVNHYAHVSVRYHGISSLILLPIVVNAVIRNEYQTADRLIKEALDNKLFFKFAILK